MLKKVRKAVFPVAGMGTRFLPATKASPKEMLPIVDKPLIQYAAEEAVAAGIEHLIFVSGRSKRAVADHFDKAYELETELERNGKLDRLKIVQNILPDNVSCIYLRQAEALGLGHAVNCAQPVVGDEPFAVMLADDLIKGNVKSALEQMIEQYNEYGTSILCTQTVAKEEISKYGVISGEQVNERLHDVSGMVEKPPMEEAPSNQAVIGRYILTPRIFSILDELQPGAGGEYQLTDAIAQMLSHEKVYAYSVDGKRYDCGSKLGYLQATVEYGLEHDELKGDFREYLAKLNVSA